MVKLRKYSTVVLTLAILFLLACGADEREEYELTLKTKIEHHELKEHIGTEPISIPVVVKANYSINDSTVQVFYRVKTSVDSISWSLAYLKPLQKDTLLATIPAAPKGTVWEYFFQVNTPTGTAITLPKHAPEKSYEVAFKGEAMKWLKISHLFLSHLTVLLMVLAAFYAYNVLSKSFPVNYVIWFSFAGFISFLLGTLLLGIWLKFQVYGVAWQGFPFGSDNTDLFSAIILVYWIICLVGVKDVILKRPWPKSWYSDSTFAYLTLAGAICYVLVGIFAHRL